MRKKISAKLLMASVGAVALLGGCNTTSNQKAEEVAATTQVLEETMATEVSSVLIRHNHLGYSLNRNKEIIVMSENDLTGTVFSVLQEDGTPLAITGTLDNSVAGKGMFTSHPFNYKLDLTAIKTAGNYTLNIGSSEGLLASAIIAVTEKGIDHEVTSVELLHHLRAMRSGTDDALYHPMSHQVDSSVTIIREADKETEVPASFTGGVDYENKLYAGDMAYVWKEIEGEKLELQGGWYDAGDYIKFTLTNAVTAYYLLRAYDVAPELHKNSFKLSKTDYNDLLDEAKFGLDYLLKVMPENSDYFIMQVGSQEDHDVGYRLPQDDKLQGIQRPAFTAILPQHMALVAAALAQGSQTFKPFDAKLSATYLAKAEALWQRAHKEDALDYYPYDKSWFYNDVSIEDNMALAAIELYEATGKKAYLTSAKKYSDAAGAKNYTSWETYNMAVNLRLAEHSDDAAALLKEDMDYYQAFAQNTLPGDEFDGTNVWGRAFNPTWAGLYNAMHVGAVAGELAAKGNTEYAQILDDNLDYLLGKNNWGVSFVATERTESSVQNIYSQLYVLQPDIFPTGAVSEGPVSMQFHNDNVQWFSHKEEIKADVAASKFNTEAEVFVDNNGSYTTMETTVFGQAVTLYMISAAYAYDQTLN